MDEAELIDADMLDYVLQSMVNNAVVASYRPAVARTREAFTELYALHWNHGTLSRCRAAWTGTGAIDVFLDKRDRRDHPQHRWAM